MLFVPHVPSREHRLKLHEHIKQVRQKTTDVANTLVVIAERGWRRSPQIIRVVYVQAIKPMSVYSAEIWGCRQIGQTVKSHGMTITKAYSPYWLGRSRWKQRPTVFGRYTKDWNRDGSSKNIEPV